VTIQYSPPVYNTRSFTTAAVVLIYSVKAIILAMDGGVGDSLPIAIDDTDDDDDGHARCDGQRKDDPAILELTTDHVTEKEGGTARVLLRRRL